MPLPDSSSGHAPDLAEIYAAEERAQDILGIYWRTDDRDSFLAALPTWTGLDGSQCLIVHELIRGAYEKGVRSGAD